MGIIMVYKPTCNWGAPSCDDSWDFWGPTLLVTKKLGVEMVWARRHLCCWFGFLIQNNFTWNLCSCFFGANCVQVLQFHCSMSFSKLVYRSLRRTYLTSGYPHTHTMAVFKGKVTVPTMTSCVCPNIFRQTLLMILWWFWMWFCHVLSSK